MKIKPEAIIRSDIRILNEEIISKEKYFTINHLPKIDKKIQNKNMIDILIGKKTFNHHLELLEGKKSNNF